ncbi:phospholipase D family protein [Rhizobium laguerreae]|uniref:Phospholipase n=1 Tax=Rhizobium laguerreae TaxID=1076926 RepID=A0A7Y2W7J5_9HYPH|nr:phospholipase D family protein [Rhizobium laguerreae]NNH66334.1 phospholipase [Rhizobium laguerreae]
MKLMLNGLNGGYLRDILFSAAAETERVDAAVAYATNDDLLFDWCWDNEIPLRFWGRFDAEVPVSIPVLSKFLARKSGRYTCKLVRHFHPKVIWWRGYGAYIGSANLTSKAWYNNVEAGVFLTEAELTNGQHDLEILEMFAEIEKHAAPLTLELFDLLSKRNKILTQQEQNDKQGKSQVLDTDLVPHWQGLTRATEKSAKDLRRQAFLTEWNGTLQIIRDVSSIISRDGNRPSWVGENSPTGAQADQFLHAHYYNTVMEGVRADYEAHYARNNANPDKAILEAIDKWRRLPSTSDENTMLNVTAPKLREAFSEKKLRQLTEDEFVAAISKVHAAREYARRAGNDVVGLKPGRSYSRQEKVVALARHMYRGPSRAAPDPRQTLYNVLYDGRPEEVPQRLWNTLNDPKTKVDLLGISTLGEIVGWAMPDRYPPRNGRTSKALRSLGYDVRVHVG